MTEEYPTHLERIVVDPQIMVGKPVVRGTRIPVELVLKRLAQNPNIDELLEAYPGLTVEDVKACVEDAPGVVQGGLFAWNGQKLGDVAPVAQAKGETTVAELLLKNRD